MGCIWLRIIDVVWCADPGRRGCLGCIWLRIIDVVWCFTSLSLLIVALHNFQITSVPSVGLVVKNSQITHIIFVFYFSLLFTGNVHHLNWIDLNYLYYKITSLYAYINFQIWL